MIRLLALLALLISPSLLPGTAAATTFDAFGASGNAVSTANQCRGVKILATQDTTISRVGLWAAYTNAFFPTEVIEYYVFESTSLNGTYTKVGETFRRGDNGGAPSWEWSHGMGVPVTAGRYYNAVACWTQNLTYYEGGTAGSGGDAADWGTVQGSVSRTAANPGNTWTGSNTTTGYRVGVETRARDVAESGAAPTSTSGNLNPAFRGAWYSVTSDTTLRAFEQKVTPNAQVQLPVSIDWYVFERITGSTGSMTQVATGSTSLDVREHSGSGVTLATSTWVTSSDMNVAMKAGYEYAVGLGWNAAISYNWANNTTPSLPWGAKLGIASVNANPPAVGASSFLPASALAPTTSAVSQRLYTADRDPEDFAGGTGYAYTNHGVGTVFNLTAATATATVVQEYSTDLDPRSDGELTFQVGRSTSVGGSYSVLLERRVRVESADGRHFVDSGALDLTMEPGWYYAFAFYNDGTATTSYYTGGSGAPPGSFSWGTRYGYRYCGTGCAAQGQATMPGNSYGTGAFGYGIVTCDDCVDIDGDGVTLLTDCDDTDPANFPGNVELCDGQDNDCDTAVDEGCNAAPVASASASPNPSVEGGVVSFTGTFTDADPNDTHTFLWSFGDGGTSTAQNPTHTYADDSGANGYPVTFTVTDSAGATSTTALAQTVNNAAPVVSVGANLSVTENTPLSFSGSFTDAGTSDTHTFLWDFGDGTSNATTLTPSHTYTAVGTYTVTLTVTDDDGGVGSDTLTVSVANGAPSASIQGPTSADEGDVLSFTGSFVDSGSGHTFLWSFGDGTTATTQNATHTYADDGTFAVTFTVTDSAGLAGSASSSVVVANVAPVAAAGANQNGSEGSPLSFTAGATDAGTADTFTYLWNFGDGATSTQQNPSHTWVDDGAYTVTLTVTDDDGDSGSDTLTATIANVAPVANAGANQSGDEGDVLSFTGSATDAGTADTFTYLWDFGDNTTSTQQNPTHAYADDGAFTVTLTVTDDDGATATDTATATISNALPVVSAGAAQGGGEGSALTFSGSFSDAGSADTHTYLWDFGDGATSSSSLTPSHTYADNGTYTVTLTVTDDDSGVGTASTTANVSNLPPSISSMTVPATADEGDVLSMSAAVTDPSSVDAAALTYLWDFGDTGTSTLAGPSHAYADDGTFTVTLTVTDPQGASATSTAQTVVSNVAPAITSSPVLFGLENTQYTYAAVASDPGTADVLTWTLAAGAPAWLSLSATGVLSGTPPTGADGSYPVSISVADDEGLSDTQAFVLVVGFEDVDNDDMADPWEADNGLTVGVDDSALDPDLDGLTNLDEFLGGTDPQSYDGPSVPVPISPLDGEEVATALPQLTFLNASDPQLDTLLYTVEIYDDLQMTTLVEVLANLPESTGGVTDVQPSSPLSENTEYAWRVWASDPFVDGTPSDLEPFFVNEVNEAPGTPALLEPTDDQFVDSLRPTFRWTDFADVDRDSGDFRFQVEKAASGSVIVDVRVAATEARDQAYTIDLDLAEDAAYLWRVHATDEHGFDGAWSEDFAFIVETDNAAPSDPVFLDPVDGDRVESVSPTLRAGESVDPEGLEITYFFEVDSSEAFNSVDRETATVPHTGTGEVSWDLDADGVTLDENMDWHARVRAEDERGGASAWDTITFFVRGPNDAPPVPALLAPEDGVAIESLSASYVVGHVADIEGDAVTYEIRVASDEAATEVLAEATGLAPGDGPDGTQDQTSWAYDAEEGGIYYWTARAVDEGGAASDWAEPFMLRITPPSDRTDACGDCEASLAPGSASPWLLLGLVALGGFRRRRNGA